MGTGAPADEVIDLVSRIQLRQWVGMRLVGIAGLAAISLVLVGTEGPGLRVLAVLAGLIPVPVLLAMLLPTDRALRAQPAFDAGASVVIALLAPQVWTAALIVAVMSPTSSATILGRRAFIVIEGVALGGLAAAAIVGEVDGWIVPVAVSALLVPLVGTYAAVYLSQERRAAGDVNLVSQLAHVIFWESDPRTGALLSVRSSITETLGYDAETVPRQVADLVHPHDRRYFATLGELAETGTQVTQCRVRHAEGHWIWLRLSLTAVPGLFRSTIKGVGMDITELVELANTDPLTALANRAVLTRELDAALHDGVEVTLLVIDLDRFKEVNDTLGHAAGDRYLKEIATRLRSLDDDLLTARIGGDEFAVLSKGADRAAAVELAEQIIRVTQESVELDGLQFSGSASVGIALAPAHGTDSVDLLKHGDLAMYAAKRAGTSVRVYSADTGGATIDRLTLSTEIERALADGELRLWYQPKYSLDNSMIVGAEGLLRWHHPERGVLIPADFLDVVEISRHFSALTLALISDAGETIARTPSSVRIAVNASIHSLVDPSFCAAVVEALDRVGADPARLVIEVTEREIYKGRNALPGVIQPLLDVGITLSIDDFGTGHSSLVRLQELPATEIKIDQQFVDQLGHRTEANVIVGSIINLGGQLGHVVIAEGVEKEYQVDALRELGCRYGQGFFWSPAVPRDELIAMCDPTHPAYGNDVTG